MATQVVKRGAKEVFPKVLPPSSPFGELLRRSKFAAFDPEIRQTYSAPASYTHRGNYGLKRPIANKKKHGYIVLKNFEEHAQYIEWDNAKEQVRWLQRVEELNVAPQLTNTTPWSAGLGPLASSKESGLDSEFCPGERAYVPRATREKLVMNEGSSPDSQKLPHSSADSPLNVDVLPPTRGKGAYGANSELPPAQGYETHLQPNISGMPPLVFQRYLKKLRKMRPEFLAFVRQELKQRWSHNPQAFVNPDRLSDEELVADLGSDLWEQNLHLRFLGLKTESMYHAEPLPEILTEAERAKRAREAVATANEPQPIHPQPHKFGGMMYAQPTHLESYFFSESEPGFFLQTQSTRYKKTVIASFAGMTAHVNELHQSKPPVFTTDFGADPSRLESGETQMRATSLNLIKPPTVVGKSATSYPISEVCVGANVTATHSADEHWRTNTHKPGSYEYSSLKPAKASTFVAPGSLRGAFGSQFGLGATMYQSTTKPQGGFASQKPEADGNESRNDLLSLLKKMSNQNKMPATFASQKKFGENSSNDGGKSS